MPALDFQLGVVLAVNPLAKDASGNDSPAVTVQSQEDGSLIPIPLANTAFFQFVPPVGTHVLFVRIGRHQARIVQMYGSNEDFIRKGPFALQEGEVMVQSPTGLGYLKIDQSGKVSLISADGNTFEHREDVSQLRAPAIRFITDEETVIEIRDDSSIRLERFDTDGETVASFIMDAKNNISFEALEDVNIKAKNIYLDGNIWMGPGAQDTIQRKFFGDLVTGGPFGTYPFDSPYSIPITGSGTVKVAK